MKHFLFYLFLCFSFASGATEAYGGSYTYRLKLFNGEGNVLISKAVTLTAPSETQTIETDVAGFITITVQRYGSCPSGKSFIQQLFSRDSWTPEVIELSYEGCSARIHRNWKRIFRHADKREESFDFKRGKVLNEPRL